MPILSTRVFYLMIQNISRKGNESLPIQAIDSDQLRQGFKDILAIRLLFGNRTINKTNVL